MGNSARSAKRKAAALVLKNSRSAFLGVCAARVAAPSPARSAFTWTAGALAELFGVAVDVIEALMRQECFIPEEVFVQRPSGALIATDAGVEKIRLALDARMADAAKASAAKAAPAKGAETLIVTRQWGAKRVLCNREGSGLEVICCVQKSENLMAGMKLESAQPGEGGLWFYYGRLPRRRGRW